ncbi:MAG: hypothetical protein R2795_24905 [Saprospiraceae bacterium]
MFEGLEDMLHPDGKKYINYSLHMFTDNYLGVYDFNRCTGALELVTIVTNDIYAFAGGVAVSNNARFVYESSYTEFYQIDLEAEDIGASNTTSRIRRLSRGEAWILANDVFHGWHHA